MSNEDSATHKNILAIKAHAERSREIVRSSEIKIMELKKTIISLKSEIEIFKNSDSSHPS